jgi:hypothetical protein
VVTYNEDDIPTRVAMLHNLLRNTQEMHGVRDDIPEYKQMQTWAMKIDYWRLKGTDSLPLYVEYERACLEYIERLSSINV